MKKGFTLPEILVAIMIVAILAVMAVPQYEKAIEKSRLAEVRSKLQQLHEAKVRMMDMLELSTYDSSQFGLENLDFSVSCDDALPDSGHRVKCQTKDFIYYIKASGEDGANAVCAKRRGGDQQDTVFVYYGEFKAPDYRFTCTDGHTGDCDVYGMSSANGLSCEE